MGYMQHDGPVGQAARVQNRTRRILVSSGIMFVIWQLSYFTIFNRPAGAVRPVDAVASVGFVAWSAALLMLVATGGGAFRSRDVREILDDELARAERGVAYQNAFWTVMVVSLAGYMAGHFTEVPGRMLAHVSLSAGVVVAATTIAWLNRRDR